MKEDKNNGNKKKNLSKSQEENSIKNKEDDDNKNKWKKSQILYDNDINTIEPKNKMNQTERKEINQEKNALKTLDNNIGFSSYNMTQTNQVKEKDEVIVDKGKMIYKKERVEIIYKKHEFVQVIDKLNTDFTKRKEKIKPNQYKLVDINDPDLFDGAIKCAQLKCILFGILSCLLNSFRLIYLIILHLIYPIILWAVRCIIAVFCFCCFMFEKEEVYIDPETKLEMIDSKEGGIKYACSKCKNCGEAFINCFKNCIFSPCWFYEFILDCIYDIKNRALDNARIGCYRFLHNDCGLYEKYVEDPFNDYNKKRSIVLSTHPNDPHVLYGDACQNNIKI